MHHLFKWEMLGISQAGVGQLLASGLVPAHWDVVAQWQVSQPAACHSADLK